MTVDSVYFMADTTMAYPLTAKWMSIRIVPNHVIPPSWISVHWPMLVVGFFVVLLCSWITMQSRDEKIEEHCDEWKDDGWQGTPYIR